MDLKRNMGGNALSTVTERKSKEEFLVIKDTILSLIDNFTSRAEVVISYNKKETFGDMDILVITNYSSVELRNDINTFIKPTEIYHNDTVWSFDYNKFQIDLIVCEPEDYEASKFYFSYNDLGNLVGRIAHKMGLKFGNKGLLLPIRHGNVSIDILLSNDQREIYDYLGYDYDVYLKGFDTLEDIFKFAITSEYFSKEPFFNQNHKNKVRNAKRKTFMEFLEFLQEPVQQNIIDYQWNTDKSMCQMQALSHFNKIEEYESIMDKFRKLDLIREKFNGSLVSEITGLTDKELGCFMTKFKAQFEDFQNWAIDSTKEEIIERIKDYERIHM